jgi:hypothetical protein
VTTWQEDLQRSLAASFAAWGTLVEAWTTAALGLWVSIVDWAGEEEVVAPTNATAVLVHSPGATRLQGSFHRADDPEAAPIPPQLVRFDPPVLPAMPQGTAMQVTVRIDPDAAAGVTDAGYLGHVLDDRREPLTTTPVYVAVHLP